MSESVTLDQPISSLFDIHGRFLVSAHLERDFRDPSALDGYVLTPQIKSSLLRLASGLKPQSGQRAWRVTGDYGSGKSSFALLVAHTFSHTRDQIPPHVREALDLSTIGNDGPDLLPVLVTGSDEPLSTAIVRSLKYTLAETYGRGRQPQVAAAIDALLASERETRAGISGEAVTDLVQASAQYVVSAGKAKGLLIVLDELGKFLEYAALNPDRQDVYVLQTLAEMAARSSKAPLFIVGLLHQGFNAYAQHLSQSGQKEWEKVAGRFQELLFNQPVEQLVGLVAGALNVRAPLMSADISSYSRASMSKSIDLGWYGAASSRDNLCSIASQIYPLHPTVLPVLIQLFSRFGQNERSLFNFLLSDEPFGLQAFSTQPIHTQRFYRIHNLYDYARCAFGHRLATQSYRTHWSAIDSVIESFPVENVSELQILKTVGLLNLLDNNSLLPSVEAIKLSVSLGGDIGDQSTAVAIQKLQRERHTLYNRGVAGGYCLWPYTSVNLDRVMEDAKRAVGAVSHASPFLKQYLSDRPLVARRHYIETGNLRHFQPLYATPSEAATVLAANTVEKALADGYLLVILCETENERQSALLFARSAQVACRPETLVAVPPALNSLCGLLEIAEHWDWISKNTVELGHDTYAAEEVSRQLSGARQVLVERIESIIGIWQPKSERILPWFRSGLPLDSIGGGRALLSHLSDVCDEVYSWAPHIQNELANRRSVSSAAAGARVRLISSMFKAGNQEMLAMDPGKKPPEMSMYLSVLKRAKLHVEQNGTYGFANPQADDDPCRISPILAEIRRALEVIPDSRISVADIFQNLRVAPFGLRDGLIPILLAAFIIINQHEIALYENGSFLRDVNGDLFPRLIKAPRTFHIQLCTISGIRAEIFEQIALSLKVGMGTSAHVLDIVRPLCVFAAKLPDYTVKSGRLSTRATAVLSAILRTEDPSELLFHQLPAACGYPPFLPDSSVTADDVSGFVDVLKSAQDELRLAYDLLLEKLRDNILNGFDLSGEFSDSRAVLARRASRVLGSLTEPRLKAFCKRLADLELQPREWLESIGSLICSKPPHRWLDVDVERFSHEFRTLCGLFMRVESIGFSSNPGNSIESAVRLSVTRSDGEEMERVLFATSDDEDSIAAIETEIRMLLSDRPKVGLIAASRVLWSALSHLEAGPAEADPIG